MTSLLEGIPTVLIQKILILAADDTKTLLRCERTCRTLRQVVGNDMTWEHVGDGEFREDIRLQSNRDRACVATAIKAIHREQRGSCHPNEGSITKNILVDELGVAGWHKLVHSILSDRYSSLLNPIDLSQHRFQFRGDALYTLAELVQEHMVIAFRQTHGNSIEHAEATALYPVLTKGFFCRYDLLLREFIVEPNGLRYVGAYSSLSDHLTLDAASEILGVKNALLRERVIRRLSYRAGVARMGSEVYQWAWTFLVQLIMQLIRPACIELVVISRTMQGQKKRRRLAFNQTIRTTPPPSFVAKCERRPGVLERVHTVVPGQIENAALSRFGSRSPNQVYGSFWLIPDVREGSQEWFEAMDQEVSKAGEQYEYEDDADVAELQADIGVELEECDMMSNSDDESEWSETYDNASDNGSVFEDGYDSS